MPRAAPRVRGAHDQWPGYRSPAGLGRRWGLLLASVGPAACVAGLLGTATALALAGLTYGFQGIAGAGARSGEAVITGALLALAAGVALPQRLAMRLCVRAWQRFATRGRDSAISSVLMRPGPIDRPLYWVVLSVIALAGGLAAALLPIPLRVARLAYDWLHLHFVWSDIPLAVLQVLLAAATGCLPLVILGLGLACAHHLTCRSGRWETQATGWGLIGGFLGAWLGGALGRWGVAPDAVLMSAAIPSLFAAVVCATVSSAQEAPQAAGTDEVLWELPSWSDRWPRLLRAGIVVAGSCNVLLLGIWAGHLTGPGGSGTLGLMLLSMGVGVLAACLTRRSAMRSIGGFGMALAAAAVIVAGTATISTHIADAGHAGCGATACVAAGAVAFATAYGRKTLLCRVASRASEGAKMLALVIAGAGVAVWPILPVARGLQNEPTVMVVIALSLLALGGMLIIHEPSYSPGKRRLRLCAVFGALGVMVAASSLPANPWHPKRPIRTAGTPTPSVDAVARTVGSPTAASGASRR